MRTLFLHPPSYEGFDGGAGSRYQARREVRSFWYPTWLAPAASPAIDFVARNEFDFTIEEVARGHPLGRVLGVSYRDDGVIRHTPDRPTLEDMDALPFVVDVYKRDLTIENYVIGYLLHPYVSLYTGRGCRSKCTFRLWPQTVGGHRYRTRSVGHVVREIALARRYFPQVREFFFDDDTFTDDLPRAEAIARGLGRLGVTWSCNAKANVPPETLRVLKDNGLRLLLVGYESGNQGVLNSVKKGVRLDVARRFTRDARALGIRIHGTFVLGLPGETQETIEETIRFACELEPDTIQVSIAAPYPGTVMYRQALEHGWLDGRDLVDGRGVQRSALSYPHLPHTEIFASVETFYRRFYFRPRKIFAIVGEMARDRQVLVRRLRDGVQFLRFLAARRGTRRGASPPLRNLPPGSGAPAKPALERGHSDPGGGLGAGGAPLPRGSSSPRLGGARGGGGGAPDP